MLGRRCLRCTKTPSRTARKKPAWLVTRQAGDRLVMERKLGRFPDETDLSVGFTPGVRFYFRYDDLTKHPGCTFDGVLPMKIKDEIILKDWLYAMVVPEKLRETVGSTIPEELADRVIYAENDCRDIWDWSEKVYQLIEKSGL